MYLIECLDCEISYREEDFTCECGNCGGDNVWVTRPTEVPQPTILQFPYPLDTAA